MKWFLLQSKLYKIMLYIMLIIVINLLFKCDLQYKKYTRDIPNLFFFTNDLVENFYSFE